MVFIVIEGIDGAGGETQSKLLKEFLEEKGFEVELLRYPDYEGSIGRLIHEFLHEKFELSPEVQFSLYATDMLKDRERIREALSKNKIVIADRYFTATLGYQCMSKGFPLEKGLKLAELFELPKPDLVIFLDVSPRTSIERKFKEKKSLDRHEVNEKFLEKVREGYLKLIEGNVFAGKWIRVNGEKSIEEVAEEVRNIVMREIKG